MKRKSYLFATFVFMALVLLTGISTPASAQFCYPGWNFVGWETITVGSCTYQVAVCRPADTNIKAYRIGYVIAPTGCPVSPALMLSFADSVILRNPANFPVLPCPFSETITEVSWGICYRQIDVSMSDSKWIPCSNSGVCITEYRICRDVVLNKIVILGRTQSSSGECSPPPNETGCVHMCSAGQLE